MLMMAAQDLEQAVLTGFLAARTKSSQMPMAQSGVLVIGKSALLSKERCARQLERGVYAQNVGQVHGLNTSTMCTKTTSLSG